MSFLPRRVVTSIVVAALFAILLAALLLAPRAARAATDPCRAFPSLSFTSVAVGQQARYAVTASTEFSRLDVKLRWSDGPEDALVSLQPGQSHVFTHTFKTPGNYSVFITASGPLVAGGGCSVFEANLGTLAVTRDDDDGNGGSQDDGGSGQSNTCSGFGDDDAIFRLPRLLVPRAVAAATDFCPQRPPGTLRWNRPSAIPVLDAGDEAIVPGPELSTTQRGATITLRTSTGDVAVTLSEDDARYRRFARRSCVYVALTSLILERFNQEIDERDSNIPAEGFVGILGLPRHLVPCLKRIDDAIARTSRAARSASVPAGGRAAAAGCRTGVFPIKVLAGTNAGSVRIRTRRSYPLPNVLRVTCSKTRTGLVVRVKPRRSGVRLRQLVGKRLSIGLLRPPGAKGSARGTVTFQR